MKKVVTLLFIAVAISGYSQQVQDFTLTNVADGKPVTLSGFTACSGLVVIFTSNECAYDEYYRARIKDLIDQYKGQIQFLLVNSYTESAESAANMKTAYGKWQTPIPYLADKDQVAMDCLGARKSPEAFLMKNSKGTFTLVYKGAIDDNPQVAGDVGERFLKASIDQLLAGQSIKTSSTRTVGCTIRRK